jgi:hypothetical protein
MPIQLSAVLWSESSSTDRLSLRYAHRLCLDCRPVPIGGGALLDWLSKRKRRPSMLGRFVGLGIGFVGPPHGFVHRVPVAPQLQ